MFLVEKQKTYTCGKEFIKFELLYSKCKMMLQIKYGLINPKLKRSQSHLESFAKDS